MFLTLVVMSIAIFVYTFAKLPETKVSVSSTVSIASVVKSMVTDRKLWAFGFLIGTTNGILFSYYAEAPFIFMNFFGMKPGIFGFFGIFVALSSILGAMLSKKLLTKLSAAKIILLGTTITLLGAFCLTGLALWGNKLYRFKFDFIGMLHFYSLTRYRHGNSQLSKLGTD